VEEEVVTETGTLVGTVDGDTVFVTV